MDKINTMTMDLLYAMEDSLIDAMKDFYKVKSSFVDNEMVTEDVDDEKLSYHIDCETPFTIVYTQKRNAFTMEINIIEEEEDFNIITSTFEPFDTNDGIYKVGNDNKYSISTMTYYEICDLCIVRDIIMTMKEIMK